MPESEIINGEFAALLTTEMLPDAAPVAAGLNVTENVSDWFGVNVRFEPPLSVKPVPEAETVETLTFELPVLVSVTFCVAVFPTVIFPKARLVELAES